MDTLSIRLNKVMDDIEFRNMEFNPSFKRVVRLVD